jgi:sugar phosphate isomerase/epimerase
LKNLKLNINAHLGCLGTFNERYVPDGYMDELTFDEQLEIFSKVEGLEGLTVWYPGHPLIDSPEKLVDKLAQYNLRGADIVTETYTDRKWRFGTISSSDKKIREEAIKVTKYTMDLAVELKANSVLFWPAHDGFDYVFQANYDKTWGNMIDSLNEIGSHNRNVKIAIEPKQKDPRAKEYIEDIGKLMLMVKSLDVDNIGGALDIGHSLFASERIAESLAIYNRYGKLYQIHLNDNYRDADPDLVFGSISFWDILEMFYWLGKTNYSGWLNIDTVTPRNDRAKMMELAVKFIKDYERLANKLLDHSEFIDKNLENHNFVDNMLLIREIIFAK